MSDVSDGWARFQSRHGLVPDGDPGRKTLAAVEAMEAEAITSVVPMRSGFSLSERSIKRMAGVHIDLQAVAHYAIGITAVDFGITATGGVRNLLLQRKLVADGASRTIRSRHVTGHALDFAPFVDGKLSYRIEHVAAVHKAFEAAAVALDIPGNPLKIGRLRYGGDWDGDGIREMRENDLVHHELRREIYGDGKSSRAPKAVAWLRANGIDLA